VKYAAVGPIAVHLPDRVETNEDLQRERPDWNLPVIVAKTGVARRFLAEPEQCSSDLAVLAAERLFEDYNIDRNTVDFVLLCTQTPDYALPTTACLVQDRLRLRRSVGALDFNLGCSGFVYGLALADGLIQSGAARRCLLITSETYSKLIDPSDRSLRTIFSDGAAATLIEASAERSLWAFEFGTDGSGADTLIADRGGFRSPDTAIRPRHKKRWPSSLYMDGPSLLGFAMGAIPEVIRDTATRAGLTLESIDWFLLHQATYKMLDQLREQMRLPADRWPIELQNVGNTVSSTLPILIHQMRLDDRLRVGHTSLLVGFGVGWSWACCAWRDILGACGTSSS
jgi:3-oxoacyl-[acyl-carrier-protein] synthase-3